MRLSAPHAPKKIVHIILDADYKQSLCNCYFFASFCLGPSLCTIPQSALHTLVSEGHLFSWYSILEIHIWPTIMLCSNFRGHMSIISWIIWVIPVQDNPSALYKNQVWALNQLQLVLYNIEASCLACTFYLHHHGLHAPDTRLLSLNLLWHCLGRGGLLWNSNFIGSSCVHTPTSPLLRESFTWSVLDYVMFHCTFWFGNHGLCQYLVLPQNFCHFKSLVGSIEGHHQTCLPLQESLTAQCVVMTICMPVFEGMQLQYLSSIAQEHLPWSIFHARLSLPFLWACHNTSKPLTYYILP